MHIRTYNNIVFAGSSDNFGVTVKNITHNLEPSQHTASECEVRITQITNNEPDTFITLKLRIPLATVEIVSLKSRAFSQANYYLLPAARTQEYYVRDIPPRQPDVVLVFLERFSVSKIKRKCNRNNGCIKLSANPL